MTITDQTDTELLAKAALRASELERENDSLYDQIAVLTDRVTEVEIERDELQDKIATIRYDIEIALR